MNVNSSCLITFSIHITFILLTRTRLSFVLIVIKIAGSVSNSFSWISNLFYSIFVYSTSFIFNTLMTAGTMWYPDMKYWFGIVAIWQVLQKSTCIQAAFAVPLYESRSSKRFASDLRGCSQDRHVCDSWDRSSAWLRRQSSSAKLARSALSYSRRYAFPRGIYTCELRLLHAGAAKGLTTRDRDTYAWEKHRRTALMDE